MVEADFRKKRRLYYLFFICDLPLREVFLLGPVFFTGYILLFLVWRLPDLGGKSYMFCFIVALHCQIPYVAFSLALRSPEPNARW